MRGPRGIAAPFAVLAAGLATLLAPAGASAALTDRGCSLLEPLSVPTPVGTGPCPGVRPGALIKSKVGLCTMNYVFRGSDGRDYVGTAGHCIIDAPQTGGDFPERRWPRRRGPVARDGNGRRIGEFAYAVMRDSEEADFALVRLDPGVASSPQMCHFGGPTRLNSSNPPPVPPTVLNHYGHGLLVGNLSLVDQPTLPARSALALGMPDPRHVFAEGAVVPGDSGGPVNSSDGKAVGVIVTTGIHTASIGTDGVDSGTMGIVRIVPAIRRANRFTRVTYRLRTAPLL